MSLSVQKLKKFLVLFNLLGNLAFATVAFDKDLFIKTVRSSIDQGIQTLLPGGYETLEINTNLEGFSSHGKRVQVVRGKDGRIHRFFIKIFHENTCLDDRKAAIAAIQKVSALWGYPKVFWHDQDYRLFITEFLEAPHATPKDFRNSAFLKEFIKNLKASHEQLFDLKISASTFLDRTKKRLQELIQVSPELDLQLKKAKEFLETFPTESNAIVHGDIQANNILKANDHGILIDWTSQHWGDVFDDLGALAEQLNFNKHQEKELLITYFGTASKKHFEKLHAHRQLNRLHFGLYFLREGLKKVKAQKAKLKPGMCGLSTHPFVQKGRKMLEGFLE